LSERDETTTVAAVAAAVRELDLITRRLRRDCPWDREQDERSIVPHTVEEAYELADAAMRGDDAALLDELGDVLFQVHFLSLLLEERGVGDMATVADHCREKLIRRHPHVFGEPAGEESSPTTAGEVLRNWDRIKKELEGRGKEGVFSDVPENLPALLYARKAQRRAASARGETVPAPDPDERERNEREIGAALFELVDRARRLRVDPELALRAETRRFMEDFESASSSAGDDPT
jgi:uncharacterized protein YabN with tetrapyrrole methylase and pyrophosphatase domain